MVKLNSHQLRRAPPNRVSKYCQSTKQNPIIFVLDNILDTYNIGSFFRLADAIAAQKIYLCGPVVTPPNIKIDRASIGTWKFVPWQENPSTISVITHLKESGYHLTACEQSPRSVNYLKAEYKFPLALVVGSETDGVGESVLKLCDQIVEIPLYGINKSLNVLVAASIIAYQALAPDSRGSKAARTHNTSS